MKRVLLAPLLLLFSCGGPEAGLQGSLGEYYDLTYERVEAVLASSELAIQYIDEDGEKVVIVTVQTTASGLAGPATVDLGRWGRIAGSSGGRPIPELDNGELILRAFTPEDGAKVEGDFAVELAGERGNVSLSGTFDTTLVDRR